MAHSNDQRQRAVEREVWFESGGTRLYAVEVGRGEPLVFLHGGLADHRSTLLRLGALATTHRVVAPDLRGSGRSIHSGALSWDQLADDVFALLEHLGCERAVIGGTSMGSAVALRFALRHPRETLGLVLISPVYPGHDRGLAEAAAAAMRAMDVAGQRALREGLAALHPLYERLPEPIRARAIEMMASFDPASVAATTRFLASGAQPIGSVEELASIAAPVLLVPGMDAEHPAELADLYARQLRRAVIVDATSPDVLERIREHCRDLR
jgi:pimeloyl-ACP methyl ester carboxylesterase